MKLAPIFTDHMVLQRDKAVCIFGESEKREIIKISIDDINVEQEINAGKWIVELPPHTAGGPFRMIVSSDEGETVLEDVLYGDVWLDNGQSNIEFMLEEAEGGADEIANGNYPEIRFYKMIRTGIIDEDILRQESENHWTAFTDAAFGEVSAIGYFYATKIYEKTGVPIGLIDIYQGGSSITCWLEEDRLEAIPEIADYMKKYYDIVENSTQEEMDKVQADYDAAADRYNNLVEELDKTRPDISLQEKLDLTGFFPWPPPLNTTTIFRPFGPVETMTKRMVPYTIKGVVYYQGEEESVKNFEYYEKTGENTQYVKLMEALIAQYRDFFGDPSLPFFYFQLPMFIEFGREDSRDWALIREAQGAVEKPEDNIYMVSLLDIGDYNEIHPKDKKTPGYRMADTLLAKLYDGDDVDDLKLKDIAIQDGHLEVSFDKSFGEVKLLANQLLDFREEGNEPAYEEKHIYGLEVSSDGATWRVPEARLEDGKMIIDIDEGDAFIQYGHFNYGRVNVYNHLGRPLRPFRRKIR